MRRGLKTVLFLCAAGTLVLVFIAVCALSSKTRRETACTGLRVEYADELRFVSEEDVEGYLKAEYGAYIGQRLDSVDLGKIESILDCKSAILKTEAYTTPDGLLNVSIAQREPVLRFSKNGIGFYCDERGFIFPLQSNYASLIQVIDGNVPIDVTKGYKGEAKTEKERGWIAQMLEMTTYMDKTVWGENISQISVLDNGDLMMIPREGKEKFIFGSPDDYEKKFRRMEKYYTTILPAKGAAASVNVKYSGQIVCRNK